MYETTYTCKLPDKWGFPFPDYPEDFTIGQYRDNNSTVAEFHHMEIGGLTITQEMFAKILRGSYKNYKEICRYAALDYLDSEIGKINDQNT